MRRADERWSNKSAFEPCRPCPLTIVKPTGNENLLRQDAKWDETQIALIRTWTPRFFGLTFTNIAEDRDTRSNLEVWIFDFLLSPQWRTSTPDATVKNYGRSVRKGAEGTNGLSKIKHTPGS